MAHYRRDHENETETRRLLLAPSFVAPAAPTPTLIDANNYLLPLTDAEFALLKQLADCIYRDQSGFFLSLDPDIASTLWQKINNEGTCAIAMPTQNEQFDAALAASPDQNDYFYWDNNGTTGERRINLLLAALNGTTPPIQPPPNTPPINTTPPPPVPASTPNSETTHICLPVPFQIYKNDSGYPLGIHETPEIKPALTTILAAAWQLASPTPFDMTKVRSVEFKVSAQDFIGVSVLSVGVSGTDSIGVDVDGTTFSLAYDISVNAEFLGTGIVSHQWSGHKLTAGSTAAPIGTATSVKLDVNMIASTYTDIYVTCFDTTQVPQPDFNFSGRLAITDAGDGSFYDDDLRHWKTGKGQYIQPPNADGGGYYIVAGGIQPTNIEFSAINAIPAGKTKLHIKMNWQQDTNANLYIQFQDFATGAYSSAYTIPFTDNTFHLLDFELTLGTPTNGGGAGIIRIRSDIYPPTQRFANFTGTFL